MMNMQAFVRYPLKEGNEPRVLSIQPFAFIGACRYRPAGISAATESPKESRDLLPGKHVGYVAVFIQTFREAALSRTPEVNAHPDRIDHWIFPYEVISFHFGKASHYNTSTCNIAPSTRLETGY